jgi:hypothetical protein
LLLKSSSQAAYSAVSCLHLPITALIASGNIILFTSYAICWVNDALKEASLAFNQPYFLWRFCYITCLIPI